MGVRVKDEQDEQAFHTLIEANAPVPYNTERMPFTTTENDQPGIDVEIWQGTRRGVTKVDDCAYLGTVSMPMLPAEAGVPRFYVQLNAENDGTLTVHVTDGETQQTETRDITEQKITVWQAKDKGKANPQKSSPVE